MVFKNISSKELEEDWTEDDYRKATPIPLPVLPKGFEITEKHEEEEVEAEILVEPTAPSEILREKITREVPFPDKYQFPYHCCGKLFFKKNGKPYVGSAAIVGKDLLLTAAHCVHSGVNGNFHTNFKFKPFYPMPYLTFKAKRIGIVGAWTQPRQRFPYSNDFAFIRTSSPFLEFGNLGIIVSNRCPRHNWIALGYPQSPPYTGDKMYMAEGGNCECGSGIVCMKENSMTGGCSGGPWLIKDNSSYISGINSFTVEGRSGNMFSPAFDRHVKYLFNCM